jgi:hypothetical protein
MNVRDLLMGRSQSLSNLPVDTKDHEDIRSTWRSKSKKRPTLQGTQVLTFNGVKAFEPKEIKVNRDEDIVTLPEAQFLESEDFELCGYNWCLRVYPCGVDEHSEHLAVKIQNRSTHPVNAYYSLSLKRSASTDDPLRLCMWVEPEVDRLVFKRFGHPDSCWGVDDLISLEELYDPQWQYMDLESDTLFVEVSMEVYGDETLASHPLKRAIEKGASEGALLGIADEDMQTIRHSMKGGGSLQKEVLYQDRLLATLAPPGSAVLLTEEEEERERLREAKQQEAELQLTSVIKTITLHEESGAEEEKE